MTVVHVYRITFKQRNCTVTIEQDTNHT